MARKKQLNSDESTAATTAAAPKKSTARKAPAAKATAAAKAPKKPLARRTKRTTTKLEAQDAQGAQAAVAEANSMATATGNAKAASGIPWRRIDLHLHTPGSHDYEEPDKTYLDILRQAEKRGLSIIAFTDHNTVNGYRAMLNEIEHLEFLERLGRIHADELWRLNEYRRLMTKILVLPGFEFTATFGFHILGIFPPDKPLRDIERVLMDLRVPGPVLDKGLTEAGATSDVLAAYEAIDEAGGIAIAAHANSSNGVSMRGMSLGGQTRIAFTQDPHLYAIEFTDLEKGRHSSAHLFTGIKPEYPRRMFAIQGSDAHRLAVSKENVKRLGVGERPTEIQIENNTFDGLKALFRSQDFERVRPVFTVAEVQDDALAVARHTGASATAAFHPALPKRGDRFEGVLRDITAMANGDGGSVFIGCDAGTKKIPGVANALELTHELADEIAKRISPHLAAHIGVNDADGAKVVVIRVPAGTDSPYVFENAHFLVRDGVESRVANRDEIVALARRGFEKARAQQQQPQQHQQRQQSDHRRQGQQGSQQPQQSQSGQPNQQGQQRNENRRDQRDQRDNRQDRRQQDRRQQSQNNQGGRQQQHRNQQRSQSGQPQSQPVQPVQPLENEVVTATATQPESGAATPAINTSPVPATGTNGNATNAANGANGANGANAANVANGGKTTAEPILPGMPRTGVQVTTMEVRNNIEYFTVRDLRNNSIIRNVTKKSARDLWHYAVTQHAEHAGGYDPATIDWAGDTDRAVLSREMRAGKMRSDLAMLTEDGRVLVFYGVTDDGIDDEWKTLIADYEAARAVNVAEPGEEEAEVPIEEFYDEPQPANLSKRNK